MSEIMSSGIKGSPIYIDDPALRAMCGCFNHTFYCVKGKLIEHSVQSYAQHLVDLDIISSAYSVVETSFDELQAFYDGAVEKKHHSYTQEDVIALIKKAAIQGASDIHLVVANEKSTLIKFRVHGDLMVIDDTKSASYGMDLLGALYNTMTDNGKSYFSTGGSADARVKDKYVKDCGLYGLRYSQRSTDNGVLVVLRLFYDKGSVALTLDSLGYTSNQCNDIHHLMQRNGMVLFSGSTGSGKSTSLAVIMRMLVDMTEGKKHILTVEDPPEFKLDGVNQTTLSHMSGYEDGDKAISAAWAEAIRSSMRLDPDIMMIGEIRDEQSAVGAIRAARTGHQVWSSIHTTNALGIYERLRDIGCDVASISNPAVVAGLINQSLAKRLCPHCKIPLKGHEHTIHDSAALARVSSLTDSDKVFIKGAGCDECQGHGFVGRVAIAEIIVTDSQIMNLLRFEGVSAAFRYWVSQGGISKCAMLIQRVNEGIIDPFITEKELHLLLNEDELLLGE
ncbi:hypothetical protein C7R88_17625 (plasmid) [Plesiomonas shigelloides]|uniref:GspE/PulE family protein n=1 Tax=Plesiomonas shigelloides TaxID=703 RepID=UPI000D11B058|nr:ATPase, T2SS/T4P/T4SS family [Plesiomonas shigelloides]AVQ89142.1 hypothetical protein C7R88_17625 [Plesiomonas shigelloides]